MYKSVRKKIAAKAYGPLAVSESTWLAAEREIALSAPKTPAEIQLQAEELAEKQGDYLPQLPA
jgi:hypothetical protein